MMSDLVSDCFPEVCHRKIGIDEFNKVYKEVKTISARWKELAIHLDINPNDTDTIEASSRGKAEESLREILKHWLKGNYDQGSHIPSWKSLCVAVKKAGDPELATKIGSSHKATTSALSRNTSRQSQSHHERAGTGRGTGHETSSDTPSVQHNAQQPNPQARSFEHDFCTKFYSVCQNHPKGVACCVLIPVLSILALIIIGVGIRIGPSHHSSNSINQSMEIGDIQSSSALIPVPSNVSSISLKSMKLLNIPSKVTVFWASSIPPYGTQILQSRIPHISGYCTPYNVNGGDEPVYLLPWSIMNYALTVSDSNYSQCIAHLVLLNNITEYDD